jgi:hypothetical protein
MIRAFIPAAVVAAAGFAIPAAPALAQIDVIFCKKGGHPKASISGWVDHSGAPVAVEFRSMNQAYVSPDGSQWVVAAQSTAPTDQDIGFVYGTGLTGAAMTLAGHTFIEGQEAPLLGTTNGFMDHTGTTNVVNWNAHGHMTFGFSVRPTQTTLSNERRIFAWNGTTLTLMARTGDLYQNHATSGAAMGTSINNYHILNDGRVGFLDSNSPSPTPSSQRPILSYIPAGGGQPQVLIHNSHQVLDIDGLGLATLTTMSTSQFGTTLNGNHWYTSGTVELAVNGPSVLVVDNPAGSPRGRVLMRSNHEIVTGSGLYPIRSSVGYLNMISLENGDMFVRLSFASVPNGTTTEGQCVWNNGAIIAKPGDPIFPGSTEHWTAIQGIAANNAGDYIIVGSTDGPVESNDVVVLNRSEVVLREGDPVSLDGSGPPDAWIGRGNNTLASLGSGQWTLTENGQLFGVVMLRDHPISGNDINTTVTPSFGTPQAFIRKILGGEPCYANCDGSTIEPILNVADFSCFLTKFAAGDPYANCDGSTIEPVLNVADFSCFLTKFAAGCN